LAGSTPILHADAVFIFPNFVNDKHGQAIVDFATARRLPSMFQEEEIVKKGGLLSKRIGTVCAAMPRLMWTVRAEVGPRTVQELEAERDEILLGLIELRTKRLEMVAPRRRS
jgi:hypothetical protein